MEHYSILKMAYDFRKKEIVNVKEYKNPITQLGLRNLGNLENGYLWIVSASSFELVMVLFGFYVLYAIQNVFDATFYGRGNTNYMLFESVVTNSIYYGGFFIAYLLGLWTPSLIGIAIMFGLGNAFDTVVSGIAYWYFLKKETISSFN